MSDLQTEYLQLRRAVLRIPEGRPVPVEIQSRLNEIDRLFDCRCCDSKSPGSFGLGPDCHCSHFRECAECSRCWEHCNCVTRGERLSLLRGERDKLARLLTEANRLAVNLKLFELEDGWTTDDLWELEKKLKAQWMAVRRLSRRFCHWEQVAVELGNLGAPEEQGPDCEYLNPPFVEDPQRGIHRME